MPYNHNFLSMQAFTRCNLNPSSVDYTQGYHEAFHVVIYIFMVINQALTLSLPECLMEFCKATLTFESADEIL